METNSSSGLNNVINAGGGLDEKSHVPDFHHEHIVKYREHPGLSGGKSNKDLIVKAKLLDAASLDRCAELLYTYICMILRQDLGQNTRILLLHAPSSAYAKGERAEDQVLAMLKRVRHMSIAETDPALRDRIDVLPHFFILNYDKRNPQHEADRSARIAGARSKFKVLKRVPELLFEQFDQIIIVDDVSTTGHTLHALGQLFAKTYPMIANRLRTISIAH